MNLIEHSKQVILDCVIENGAIVAANNDKAYFPKQANNYRFVWPRDVAFTLYAAGVSGLPPFYLAFCQWLLERAEGFEETGLLYQRYATSGSRDLLAGSQWQVDQAGALIWSLCSVDKAHTPLVNDVITRLCRGITESWSGTYFTQPTHDLWEERQTFPAYKDNFTYSVSTCAKGLQLAAKRLSQPKWDEVATEMIAVLQQGTTVGNHYPRISGVLDDCRIDASMLGIIWPFNVVAQDDCLKQTLLQVESQLLTPQGVMRYEHDEYDGTLHHTQHLKKGAGGWPLLTYWYVIALKQTGRHQDAVSMFQKYSQQFSRFIPEQVFNNNVQKSVSPLCWSHSMYLIAADLLGHNSNADYVS